MKVSIDISPLKSTHRFRGIGTYTKNLTAALKKKESDHFSLELREDVRTCLNTDLVHYPYFDLFYHTLPFRKPAKTVVTIHDVIPLLFPKHYPPGVKGIINFHLQKLSLKTVSAVFTDSESSKRDIIQYLRYPAKKIHVVYLAPAPHFRKFEIRNSPAPADGARPGKFEILRRKYHLPSQFVLYVGDANYHKNVLGLVKACREVKTPLILVGKSIISKDFDRKHPENTPLVELQKEIESDPLISALGFVPDEDLVAIYNLATIYCQPSFYEGFGLGVLEAMACGCPVVSTRVGSLPEIAGKSALLVEPEVGEIARALKVVLKNPAIRDKLIRAGIKQSQKFTWEKTATLTVNLYRKVYEE